MVGTNSLKMIKMYNTEALTFNILERKNNITLKFPVECQIFSNKNCTKFA